MKCDVLKQLVVFPSFPSFIFHFFYSLMGTDSTHIRPGILQVGQACPLPIVMAAITAVEATGPWTCSVSRFENAPLFDECGNKSLVSTAHWTGPSGWKTGCGLSRLLTLTNFCNIKQLKFRLMCYWYTLRLGAFEGQCVFQTQATECDVGISILREYSCSRELLWNICQHAHTQMRIS